MIQNIKKDYEKYLYVCTYRNGFKICICIIWKRIDEFYYVFILDHRTLILN